MFDDALGVRAALSSPPFASFCEFKTDEPPRRGRLEALCGGDPTQRPAPPAFEQHYRSRHPQLPTTIEAYGRSAAGVVVETGNLRTPEALEKSMHFLVHHYLREPHTAAIFTAPFDVWRHLWDRMRQVRTNWVPQLPQVGAESHRSADYPNGELPRSVKESKRRLQWLEFTVAALALGGANLCRTLKGCRMYMAEKQNFLESMAQCFSDLVLSYRAEQRLRNSEFFSVIILFYGLSQLSKIENRAGFCRAMEIVVAGEAEATHVFELASNSVDFGSVYRELAYLPSMARTRHVRTALKLIHSWCQREWFRFFFLCRTEPLTVLQRAIVFQSFSYARFRAVLDLVTANVVVYSKLRLRGEMHVAELADLLLMETPHCVELLETMGLAGQLSEDRTILRLARHDSSSYTTQEAIFRHLEDGGKKPMLCLPTFPSFFGFRVWKKAFDLFPEAFGPNPAAHADLHVMTCPVNVMELLEPYCPSYNPDVAALELTDVGNEWFDGVQKEREHMLRRAARTAQRMRDGFDGNTESNVNVEDNYDTYDNDEGYGEGVDNSNTNNEDKDNDESIHTESDEKWRAIAESLDRESKSTHSSIFSHEPTNDMDSSTLSTSDKMMSEVGGKGKYGEVDDDDEETHQSPKTEEVDVENESGALRAATELIESLQKDVVYIKLRQEMKEKKESHEDVMAESDEETHEESQNRSEGSSENAHHAPTTSVTVTPAASKSSLQSEQTTQEKPTLPWRTIAARPGKATVVITPLPNDHPGVMSPSLTAIVETPKSAEAPQTDAQGAKCWGTTEVEEEEGDSTKKSTPWTMAVDTTSRAAATAATHAPFFTTRESTAKIALRAEARASFFSTRETAPAEPVEPITNSRTTTTKAAAIASATPTPTLTSTSANSLRFTVQFQSGTRFPPTSMPQQAAEVQKRTPSENPTTEPQERTAKRRREEPNTESTSIPPPQPSAREMLLPFEEPTSTSAAPSSQRTRVDHGEIRAIDPDSMRRVSFADATTIHHCEPPRVISYKDVIRATLHRDNTTTMMANAKDQSRWGTRTTTTTKATSTTTTNTNTSSTFHSSNDATSAVTRDKYNASGKMTTPASTSMSSEHLIAESLLTAAVTPPLLTEPQWTRHLTQYLTRAAASSCGDAQTLLALLRGDASTKMSGIAGWLCRGFAPFIVPYIPPHSATAVPLLCFASTFVLFGSGLRSEAVGNKMSMHELSQSLLEESAINISHTFITRVQKVYVGDRERGEEEFNTEVEEEEEEEEEESLLRDNKYDTDHKDCSPAVMMSAMMELATARRRSPSLGLWVASLFLSPRSAASLLVRGTVYTVEDDNDDQIGLWQALHRIPSTRSFVQTQLRLHAVDFRDASTLQWASVNQSASANTTSAAATETVPNTGPLTAEDHFTAIVVLDATLPREYAAGLETLWFLVRLAAQRRSVFLPGVLVVLHTASPAEDARVKAEIEKQFWIKWTTLKRDTVKTAAAATSTGDATSTWRKAYQETIRRAMSKEKKTPLRTHPSCSASTTRATAISISNSKPTSTSSRQWERPSSGFFNNTANVIPEEGRVSGVCGSVRRQPPSPVLVILPIRTAVQDVSRRGDNTRGKNFASFDMETMRVVLTKAVEGLVRGYEVKWQEFLDEKNTWTEDTSAEESVTYV